MIQTTTPYRTKQRGLIITDAVIGLAVLAVLLAITAITVGQDKRVQRTAEEHRGLTYEAEAALTALQAEQPLQTPTNPAVKLSHAVMDAEATPPNRVWLRITASDGQQSSEVIGLVPAVGLADRLHIGTDTKTKPGEAIP